MRVAGWMCGRGAGSGRALGRSDRRAPSGCCRGGTVDTRRRRGGADDWGSSVLRHSKPTISTEHQALAFQRDGRREDQGSRRGPAGGWATTPGSPSSCGPPPRRWRTHAPSPRGRRCWTWRPATGTSRSRVPRRARAWWRRTWRPRWCARGRERSEAEGYEIEWVEADAEELPFEDARFDCVGSVFGAMIAPRPRVAAEELFRVVRPGQHGGHDRVDAREQGRASCSRSPGATLASDPECTEHRGVGRGRTRSGSASTGWRTR